MSRIEPMSIVLEVCNQELGCQKGVNDALDLSQG